MIETMEFIDSHAHLNAAEFKQNWPQIVQTATQSGIVSIVNNAGDLASSEWGIEQSNNSAHLYATVGIHPEFFLESDQPVTTTEFNNLRRLAKNNSKVVAIGEIGLDYTLDATKAPPAKQHELLAKQLEIAVELNLPVTLHVRDQPGQTKCFTDLLNILQQFTTYQPANMQELSLSHLKSSASRLSQINSDDFNDQKPNLPAESLAPISNLLPANSSTTPRLTGVFHCWTGTPQQLQQALEIGFYVSFSGILTYKSAGHILEAAKLAPLDKILIETDAPYLTPEPARTTIRPSVNQPKYVIMTAEKLASIKELPLQTIAEATTQNTRRLFKLS